MWRLVWIESQIHYRAALTEFASAHSRGRRQAPAAIALELASCANAGHRCASRSVPNLDPRAVDGRPNRGRQVRRKQAHLGQARLLGICGHRRVVFAVGPAIKPGANAIATVTGKLWLAAVGCSTKPRLGQMGRCGLSPHRAADREQRHQVGQHDQQRVRHLDAERRQLELQRGRCAEQQACQ